MALYVDNIASETVNVCFVIYYPECASSGQPWRKVAWYVTTPGLTIVPDILDADLNKESAGYSGNRNAYLYAYTASDDKECRAPGTRGSRFPVGCWQPTSSISAGRTAAESTRHIRRFIWTLASMRSTSPAAAFPPEARSASFTRTLTTTAT